MKFRSSCVSPVAYQAVHTGYWIPADTYPSLLEDKGDRRLKEWLFLSIGGRKTVERGDHFGLRTLAILRRHEAV